MNNKLYVGNLDYSISNEELKEAFSAWEITDCKLIENKGFAFITFAQAEDAAAAKEQLSNQELKGRPMKIDFAQERTGASRGGGRSNGFQKRRF